ncbi:MAG: hypothetical protein M3281_05230 [Chloroflexota bacterium]|nr:hypothetical protein [Chloroflexota bacterium]
MQSLFSPSAARVAGTLATIGLLLSALLQLLVAVGVIPITWTWGGTQDELTVPLRLASVVAAVILGLSVYVRHPSAGLVGETYPSRTIRLLVGVVTLYLLVNILANLASQSGEEGLLFGPITLITALACLVVVTSRPEERSHQS